MKTLIAIITVISSISFAYARGGVDGGGGNGVVCRDNNQNITSVRLLDLYEGEILYDLEFSDQHNTIEQGLIDVAAKMEAPHFEHLFLATHKAFKMLPTGVRLEPIDDSGHIFIPANCKIEQMANYYNSSKVFIVSDFYNKLSVTDKIALVVHETVFAWERMNKVENSRYARRITSHAMADNFTFENPREGTPKKGLFCKTPLNLQWGSTVLNPGLTKITGFWAIPIDDGYNNWRFQFANINGHTVYSKTYVDFNIDSTKFNFPLQLIENFPSIGEGITQYGDLVSKLDVNQTFTLSLMNDDVNLDFFTGPRPTPGPWMDQFSTGYMTFSWTGFDPADEVTKAQFLCGEVIIHI